MDSYLPLLMAFSFIFGIIVASFLWNQDVRKKFGQSGKNESSKKSEKVGKSVSLPFINKACLFSDSEHNVYKQLTWAVGDDLLIFPKVRLIDAVSLKKRAERKSFYTGLAKIRRVDFLLCDKKGVKPVLMVTTSQYDDEGEQESLTQRIAHDAGIASLLIPKGKTYAPSELKHLVIEAIAETLRLENEKLEEATRKADEKMIASKI